MGDNTEKALGLFMTEYHIEDRDVAIRRIVERWLADAGYLSSAASSKLKGGATDERDDSETVQYPEFRDGDGGPGSGG